MLYRRLRSWNLHLDIQYSRSLCSIYCRPQIAHSEEELLVTIPYILNHRFISFVRAVVHCPIPARPPFLAMIRRSAILALQIASTRTFHLQYQFRRLLPAYPVDVRLATH